VCVCVCVCVCVNCEMTYDLDIWQAGSFDTMYVKFDLRVIGQNSTIT